MKKALALLALTLLTATTTYSVLNAASKPKSKEIKITLEVNDGSGLVKEFKTSEQFPLNNLKDPYKQGYKFIGWTLNDELVSKLTPISQDVVLKAKWEQAFEVTFEVPENAILRSHKVEIVQNTKSIKKPYDPYLEGQKFLGWYDGDDMVEFPYTPTKNTTLLAKFSKKYNVVTLNLNGGNGVEDKILVPVGEKLTNILEPKKEGLTFDKWQLNEQDYDFNQVVTQDITLNAVYRQGNTLTLVYNDKGKTSDKVLTILPAQNTEEPETPTLENHKFLGWYDQEGTKFEFGYLLTKSVILQARWEQLAFSVSFVVSEEATFEGERNLTIQKDQNITKPAQDPTMADAEFLGWFVDDVKFESFDMPITKDLVLVAKFDVKRTVTFDLKEGTAEGLETTKKVAEGQFIEKPTQIPTKDGHMFEGWYLNGIPYNFETPVTSNITIYAEFSKEVEATPNAHNHPYSSFVLAFGNLTPNSEFATNENSDGNITDQKVIESYKEKLQGTTLPSYFKYRDSKLEMYFDNTPEDGDVITVKQGFPVYKHTEVGYLKIGYVKQDLKLTKVDGKYIFVDETVKDKTLEIVYYLGQGSQKHYAILSDGKETTVTKEENKLKVSVTYSTDKALSVKLYETQEAKENNKITEASEQDKLLSSKELDLIHVKTTKDSTKFALVEGYEENGIFEIDDTKSFLTIFLTTTKDLGEANPRVWHWGLNSEKYTWGQSPEFRKISEKDGKKVYLISVELVEAEISKEGDEGLIIYTNDGKFTGNMFMIEGLQESKTYKAGQINFVFIESNELSDRGNEDNANITARTTIEEKQVSSEESE